MNDYYFNIVQTLTPCIVRLIYIFKLERHRKQREQLQKKGFLLTLVQQFYEYAYKNIGTEHR